MVARLVHPASAAEPTLAQQVTITVEPRLH